MKKLLNNFTTPEQSKRLLDLGVPADSADCYYRWYGFNGVNQLYQTTPDVVSHDACVDTIKDRLCHGDIPCWSVGRIIEIMTICYKWDFLSSASFRIYRIDIVSNNVINHLINDFSLEISRGKMDFSKLED